MLPREILISEEQIQKRVAEMAAEIRRDFPDDVHLIAVLKGAFIFLSDLVRHIPRPGLARLHGGRRATRRARRRPAKCSS